MSRIAMAAGILVLICGSVFAGAVSPAAAAESEEQKKHFLYEWTDGSGTVNVTDTLGKVPEQYRSRMRVREVPKGEAPAVSERSMPGTAASSYELESRREEEKKAEWQKRLRDWKQHQENAEKRYEDLEQERNELFRAWGSAALAPIANRQKAERIEQQMKVTQKEIERAREMVEELIPEEARKAGVPPGWLRDVK